MFISNLCLHVLATGEWSGPPRSGTPHGSGGSPELGRFGFHDGATRAHGGARERHHHHAIEA